MWISGSVRNPDRVGGIARGLSVSGTRCQKVNSGQNDQVDQRKPWSCTAVGLIADVGARGPHGHDWRSRLRQLLVRPGMRAAWVPRHGQHDRASLRLEETQQRQRSANSG